MVMIMVVPVTVIVAMTVRMIVIIVVAMRVAGADAFDVMMVAFLRQPDLGLEAQHLFAVFAELAVHFVFPLRNFIDPFHEGLITIGWSFR